MPFPFTDLSSSKNRPALVLVNSDNDVMVCFLTTQLSNYSEYDIKLNPTKVNGLKKTSIIKISKIATLDQDLALGKLGCLTASEIILLNKNLIDVFKLSGDCK